MTSRLRWYCAFVAALALLFSWPLGRLAVYSAGTDLHSHVLLIPFISAYLLHARRQRLPAPGRAAPLAAMALGGVASLALAARVAWGGSLSVNDTLALAALAFIALLAAGGFAFLGSAWMAAAAFPFGFLLFMIPMPDAAVHALEQASASASAEAAALYFWIAGTPLVRRGTVFELPGIVLQVAEECSGIRSSWVLFITSTLASQMFLRSPWKRAALVAFVIPLGILRNGFRVFVIGILCVHVGPHMVDSPVHRQGGPVFFALSLVPLFALLWWLKRREAAQEPRADR